VATLRAMIELLNKCMIGSNDGLDQWVDSWIHILQQLSSISYDSRSNVQTLSKVTKTLETWPHTDSRQLLADSCGQIIRNVQLDADVIEKRIEQESEINATHTSPNNSSFITSFLNNFRTTSDNDSWRTRILDDDRKHLHMLRQCEQQLNSIRA